MYTRLGKPKTVKVTRDLARSYAEMAPAPHDRPLSDRRVKCYQEQMPAGKFHTMQWCSIIVHETDEVYRVNGKHTSLAIVGLPDPLPELYANIEEFESDHVVDIASLYATFDSGLQLRRAQDIYLGFTDTIPELQPLPAKVKTAAVTGIAFIKCGGHDMYVSMLPADRGELVLDYPEFVLWLNALVSNGPSASASGITLKQRCNQLLRLPVVGAMFATWCKVKGDATRFWELVRDESSPENDSMDRKLARYLLLTGMQKREQGGKLRTASTRELYVKCLKAWNHWRRSTNGPLTYNPDEKVPTIV